MSGTRRPIAFSLAMAVLNLSASIALASPPNTAVALGTLRASGVVTVNDLRALSGQTIISSSKIVTARKANAILELGDFTRLMMSDQTELTLDFSAASVSGSLRQGEMRAFIPAARTLSITTPYGAVVTDPSQSAVFSVQVNAGLTQIFVESGRVELRAGKSSRVLGAGEKFSTDCDTFAVPIPQQHLNKGERVGIIAGIGAGVAVLLTLLIGRNDEEEPEFGGCAIILSPTNPPQTCH